MKIVNQTVKDAIRTSFDVNVVPRLVAEWNMNRYFAPTADNYPSEDSQGYDIEIFPIESIVRANRPFKGIAKARIGEATTGGGYDVDRSRYYIGSVDDVYKYWTSPVQTDGSGVFPTVIENGTAYSMVRPHIVYNETVKVNKIVVKFDNYWATPDDFFIKVTYADNPTSMSDWATISTAPTIASDGSVTLYWNGATWTTVRPSGMVNPPLRSLRGIMVQVDSMIGGKDMRGRDTWYRVPDQGRSYTRGANSFFNLIEICACREEDLTDRLISVDDDFELSDVSELYPIGTITSNTGSLVLSNIYTENGVDKTGYFNPGNPSSNYAGILEPNTKFNLEYVYTIDGTAYPIQQFVMYGSEWRGLVSDEVEIELSDFSKFFNEIYPNPALWSDLTAPEIIQRLLDSVGFVNWSIDDTESETKHLIPNFWVDGEKNVWEILDELAKATQTAIYFDGWGKLRIKTRRNAFRSARTPDWTLRAVRSGDELEDIFSLEQGEELGANHLTITYKSTTWSREVHGIPAMDKIWEPDTESVVLRASSLMRDIDDNTTVVHIPEKDSRVWPFTGMFQIQGEIFKYKGKQFCYFTYTENTDSNGNVTYSDKQQHYVNVTSWDEYKEYNQKTPYPLRHENHWTGGLVLDDDGRAVWNSEQRGHSVDINGWNVDREFITGGNSNINRNAVGMTHNRDESSMRLHGAPNASINDITIATHGNPGQDAYKFFGTQIKLIKQDGRAAQQAGIVLNCDNSFHGYYVEIKASSKIANKDRKSRGEIALFNRTGTSYKQLDSANFPIVENLIYDVDVQIKEVGGNHQIIVWINGQQKINKTVSEDIKPMGGQFATYVRGKTLADFQYFYAIRREVNDPADDASFFNLQEGGYTGRFWDREWVWGWKTVTRRKKKNQTKERVKWGLQFFDDFGPIVHEVREFNVKFDPKPVLHSRLYMSNEWTAICPEYRSNPFGAYFVLTNAARENAVIHGEDSLVFGNGATTSINQILTVIGRTLIEQDEETIQVSNEDSIRVRGKIEAELESTWIQSKNMAQDVASWMSDHWSKGLDQLTVEIFGNPLIEVGDVVSVDYPDKFMSPTTHKYFVVSVGNSFKSGITTTLGLRRVA